MADIEPSGEMRKADERARKLITQLERMNVTAAEATAQAEENVRYRTRLQSAIREDVKASRVAGGTVSGGVTRAPEVEKRTARDITRETSAARRETERLASARIRSSRVLEQDLAAMRRYGDYAGSRYLAAQGRSPASIQALRAMQFGRPPQLALPAQAGPLNPSVVYGSRASNLPEDRPPGPTGPYVVGQRGVAVQRTAEIEEGLAAQRKLDTATARATLTQAEQNRVMSQGVNSLSAHSTALRRHGALTTEFISAAARGTVTIREMGYQVGATIGKFAGWLVAGSAVFAALGAVQALGKGAIDSASGVNQLDRVLTQDLDVDALTSDFRGLSKEFNLPIEDVTGAAYGMGKVFQSQEGAIEGARSALFAMKVGELDTATATRYLTAIVNGFGLSGAQMAQVMDQLNEAQNRFGVSIPDTAAGVAKAAGTFKAAGGDIDSLIALITTAQKVTGQTGEVVGTALARSPNFLRQDQNRAILQSFGINASADIDDIIERAFSVSKRLGGEDRQVLASAIFGPQYGARIGTPLLDNEKKYREALEKTSPDASKGSAQRELDTLLGSYQERIAAIGNSLQRIGSNLATAGALAPFGLALEVLQQILDTTSDLLELFNELPTGLRTAAVVGLQLYGTLRLMRRLQFGSLFPEGSATASFFTPRNQQSILYKEGLFNQKEFLGAELEQAGKNRAALASQLVSNQQRLVPEKKALGQLSLDASAQEANLVAGNAAERTAIINNLQRELLAAETVEADLLERRQVVLAQQALLKKGFDPALVAGVYGTQIPGAQDSRIAALHAEALGVNALYDARAAGTPLSSADGRRLSRLTGETTTAGRRLSGWLANFGATGTAASKVTTAASRIPLSRIGNGLRGAGTSLLKMSKGLGAMLGPLDLLLLGGFAIYEIQKHINDAENKLNDQVDDIISTSAAPTRNVREDLLAQIPALGAADAAAGGHSFAGDFRRALQTELGAFINPVSDELGGPHLETGEEELLRKASEVGTARRTLNESLGYYNEALRAIAHDRVVEGPASLYVDAEAITKQVDEDIGRFNAGRITLEQFNKATDRQIQSLRNAGNLTSPQKREKISEILLAQIDTRGVGEDYRALTQLTIEDEQKLIDQYSTIVSSGEASANEVESFMRTAVHQLSRTLGQPGVENSAAAIQAADSMSEGLKSAADANLERALLFAESQQDIDAAYDDYVQALSPRDAVKVIQDQRADARARLQAAVQAQKVVLDQRSSMGELGKPHRQTKLGALTDQLDPAGAALRDSVYGVLDTLADISGIKAERERLTEQLKKRQGDAKKIREELDGLDKTEKLLKDRMKALREEARQARFDERTDFLDSLHGYRESLAQAGGPRLQLQLRNVNLMIDRMLKDHARNSKEVLDLLTERSGIQDEIASERLALIQSQGAYRTAGIDPARAVAVARSELATAIASQGALGPHASEADIVDAATAVRQAEQAVQDAIEERADALRAARFELDRANAYDDEIAQARIDLREARSNFATADTLAEKIEARAGIKDARHALQEQRAQTEIDDVSYAADIGKLSLSAQIREYTKILNTMKLTRDMRRDLRTRIYQLKQEMEGESGGFDLSVGDIKLPTIYEIKRAIGGGVGQAPNVTVQQTNNYNVNGATDTDAVMARLGGQQRDAANRNRNALRSAGVL